jgi:hypothetical protein
MLAQIGIAAVENGMASRRNVNRLRNRRSNYLSREGCERRWTMSSKWLLLLLLFAGIAAIVAVERIL